MQALARETNLSESAFVLRPTTPEADVRIRIFAPTMELPFAGHPTLGSAFVLADTLQQEVLRLETGKGVVTVRLTRNDGRPVFGWMNQPLPSIESFTATAELFAALRVHGSKLPVDLYDNGPHYVFVELGSPDEVIALRPDLARLAALGRTAFSVFARHGDRWKTRVFAPGEGIAEDPATGAAAGPHALHLARHGRIRFGDKVLIEQGAEIGRPSTLHALLSGTPSASSGSRLGVAPSWWRVENFVSPESEWQTARQTFRPSVRRKPVGDRVVPAVHQVRGRRVRRPVDGCVAGGIHRCADATVIRGGGRSVQDVAAGAAAARRRRHQPASADSEKSRPSQSPARRSWTERGAKRLGEPLAAERTRLFAHTRVTGAGGARTKKGVGHGQGAPGDQG